MKFTNDFSIGISIAFLIQIRISNKNNVENTQKKRFRFS
ncbi:hypothetical protein EU96_1769 [Prochlorococcus marinus str. MIT 9302]|uniref:Uncharacterized protein n=1 Tax=Prochlorococcus marinus str. MIT 9302 TaxID=74545 RepID=A0A0A2A9N5_PROMR|nr:hypothetical protein EU96_1769 [Prochlorococcus marinus str. MIT 9302]